MDVPEAVAVRVVDPIPTVELSTRAGGMGNVWLFPDKPVHVVGQNRHRTRLVLSVNGDDVYIGTSESVVRNKTGFRLPQNEPLPVFHSSEVWAMPVAETSVELSYMEETCR
jgi:hypothetical protein